MDMGRGTGWRVYESPAIKYSDIFGAISIGLSNHRGP
jgi:hypothetical protein